MTHGIEKSFINKPFEKALQVYCMFTISVERFNKSEKMS